MASVKEGESVQVVALAEGVSENEIVVELPKMVKEYPMPAARQTHEMVLIEEANTLLVTQQTNSTLIKIRLDGSATFRPLSCKAFMVGNFWSGVHGLTRSQAYPSSFWATLQFESKLLRFQIDPKTSDLSLQQTIHLPSGVNGPHGVIESGNYLWTTCKDSSHVVRVNHRNPYSDVAVFPCSRRPILLAVHPISHDVYASLDVSSKIWRLVVHGSPTEIDIPENMGKTPVGLVAGPDRNVWFTLVGDESGGNGTFARISADGQLTWFRLNGSIGSRAALIHLAFDWSTTPNNDNDNMLTIWLLASSLVAGSKSVDAVLAVVVNTRDAHIVTQQTIMFPTQLSGSHRVLPVGSDKGLFVTLLNVSTLVHIMGPAALKPSFSRFLTKGETTDFSTNFGQGINFPNYTFSEHPTPPFKPFRKKNAT